MSAKTGKNQRNMRGTVPDGSEKAPTSPARADHLGTHAAASGLVSRRWPVLVAATSALALLAAAIMMVLSLLSVAAYGNLPAGSKPNTPQSERRALGNPRAPVVITEWFDFQCPACGRFAVTVEPTIEKLYVNTGKVRWISRNYAFLGPESFLAAEAAEAAADQGRYWDYYALLFRRQRGENQGAFRPENLKRFAAELGLNQQAFNDALDQRIHREAILAEAKEAEAQGVKATPTFFINGRKIEGAPTADGLARLIEEELATKQ